MFTKSLGAEELGVFSTFTESIKEILVHCYPERLGPQVSCCPVHHLISSTKCWHTLGNPLTLQNSKSPLLKPLPPLLPLLNILFFIK